MSLKWGAYIVPPCVHRTLLPEADCEITSVPKWGFAHSHSAFGCSACLPLHFANVGL